MKARLTFILSIVLFSTILSSYARGVDHTATPSSVFTPQSYRGAFCPSKGNCPYYVGIGTVLNTSLNLTDTKDDNDNNGGYSSELDALQHTGFLAVAGFATSSWLTLEARYLQQPAIMVTHTNNNQSQVSQKRANVASINGLLNTDINSYFSPYLSIGADLLLHTDTDSTTGSRKNSQFVIGNVGVGLTFNFSNLLGTRLHNLMSIHAGYDHYFRDPMVFSKTQTFIADNISLYLTFTF